MNVTPGNRKFNNRSKITLYYSSIKTGYKIGGISQKDSHKTFYEFNDMY